MNAIILNTRTEHQAPELSLPLRRTGAQVLEFPVLEIAPPLSWAPVAKELESYHPSDWFVFTSANGVEGLVSFLESHGEEEQISRGAVQTAAVGKKTAEVAARFGFRASVVPKEATGAKLAEAFLAELKEREKNPKRVYLFRTNTAEQALPERLQKAGLKVSELEVYRSVIPSYSRKDVTAAIETFIRDTSQRRVLVFTSRRGVEHFFELVRTNAEQYLQALLATEVAVLGRGTRIAAEECGFQSVKVSRENSVESLIETIRS